MEATARMGHELAAKIGIAEQDPECPSRRCWLRCFPSDWRYPMIDVMSAASTDPFATPAARWAAVQRRDRAADGHFLFSVDTTGVYCRPSCASRAARPEHVAFHRDSAAAERAGFRA